MPEELIRRNREWASGINQQTPDYFSKLAALQKPDYFWIGCADARVPANVIAGLEPGEVFVHRNVANVVHSADLNLLSALEFAVEALKVKEIILCGHYGCGGVQAAMGDQQVGLVDHWLRNIRDVYFNKQNAFGEDLSEKERVNLLCELNVAQQVANVTHLPAIQNAWEEGQELSVHGWIYDINDGLLKRLTPSIDNIEQVAEQYRVKRKLL